MEENDRKIQYESKKQKINAATNAIEMVATTKIVSIVLESYFDTLTIGSDLYLSPCINVGDRQPLWDGFIYINSDSSLTNDDFEGKIETQIKGSFVKKYTSKCTYPIKTSVLKAYQKEKQGTILLYVKFKSLDDYKVYYRYLLPSDLYKILNDMNNKGKKVFLSS